MSDDLAQVFHRWAEYWNRRELETALAECVHPDVEWLPIDLDGSVYVGHDGVRRWTERLFHDWEVFEVHVEQIRELDENRLLVLGHWRARGRGSGLDLDSQQASWLTDFRDGKIARLQTFTDRQMAFEVTGLDP